MKFKEISICLIGCLFVCGCVRVEAPEKVKLNIDNGEYSQNNADAPSSGQNEGEKSGWLNKLDQARHTVSNSLSSDFYTDDVLAVAGNKVKLVAHCDLEDESKDGLYVTFSYKGKEIGQAVTDKKGIVSMEWLPPDSERVYVIDVSSYLVHDVKREKKYGQSKLTVSVQDKNTPIIIVDLDKTLVEGGFFKVVFDSAKPLPYSSEAMNRIAEKYSIVYLTHRISGMTTVSKQWLGEHGFPAGPLLTNKSGELSSGDYKYGRLVHLKEKFRNIEIGVGDKESDIESCRSNGIRAYWILKYEDEAGRLRKLAKKAAKFSDDEDVQVVVNWREIEEGILRGKDFSAARRSQEFRDLAMRQKKLKEETE